MDLDQLASEKPADLDLHCFQNQDISRFSMVGINTKTKEGPSGGCISCDTLSVHAICDFIKINVLVNFGNSSKFQTPILLVSSSSLIIRPSNCLMLAC